MIDLSARKAPLEKSEKLADVESLNLLIESVKDGKSEFGPLIVMNCYDMDGKEWHSVMTSAPVVLKSLANIAKSEFPITARFVKVGGKFWDIQPVTSTGAVTEEEPPF